MSTVHHNRIIEWSHVHRQVDVEADAVPEIANYHLALRWFTRILQTPNFMGARARTSLVDFANTEVQVAKRLADAIWAVSLTWRRSMCSPILFHKDHDAFPFPQSKIRTVKGAVGVSMAMKLDLQPGRVSAVDYNEIRETGDEIIYEWTQPIMKMFMIHDIITDERAGFEFANFPQERLGDPDWAATLEKYAINARWSPAEVSKIIREDGDQLHVLLRKPILTAPLPGDAPTDALNWARSLHSAVDYPYSDYDRVRLRMAITDIVEKLSSFGYTDGAVLLRNFQLADGTVPALNFNAAEDLVIPRPQFPNDPDDLTYDFDVEGVHELSMDDFSTLPCDAKRDLLRAMVRDEDSFLVYMRGYAPLITRIPAETGIYPGSYPQITALGCGEVPVIVRTLRHKHQYDHVGSYVTSEIFMANEDRYARYACNLWSDDFSRRFVSEPGAAIVGGGAANLESELRSYVVSWVNVKDDLRLEIVTLL
jgi:hypothetical protein